MRRILLEIVFLFLVTTCSDCQKLLLPGSWEVLVENAGIASMHTAVTRFNTVVLLDRTDIGPSRLSLPPNQCRNNPTDLLTHHDCTAHSALFDPTTRRVRPLSIITDTWCSSGQFLSDGTLLQTGGDYDGLRRIRSLRPSPYFEDPLFDWNELQHYELTAGRWYATNQILPDGSVIIVGGRSSPSLEFFPPKTKSKSKTKTTGPRPFPFLSETKDAQMDNLYPYVHLLPDGNLFIFANTKAILYDHFTDTVIRYYPELKGVPRNYPSAGSSAMLSLSDDHSTAEVIVCGGSGRYGVFAQHDSKAPAEITCGRITATDVASTWKMEDMPWGRIMGDMVMLPTGDVLIINGAKAGSQGFELGSTPSFNPVLYRPNEPFGHRFTVLAPTDVPRLYHSTANLLPDGRILVAGSNPHHFYQFGDNVTFPTELRLEAFSPEYLSPERANHRPKIELAPEKLVYGTPFEIEITVELAMLGVVEVNLGSAPFATHSFSMGQRLLKLNVSQSQQMGQTTTSGNRYRIGCIAPATGAVAPPGFYMMFAVNQGIPSVAKWVQMGS
ncbi:Galactose oxidase [Zostera marina]|uniref:Galactose oxidase n=1 Tax=Zostera marina TaxID=29655 RepID=A0A0K9PEW3_ZOSMR|nr:Galactose oxidase [Zostera marina]